MCRMHSHAGLLRRVGPCFLGQDTCGLITSQQHKALKCVCMRQYFYLYSKLDFLSRPEFAVCCLVLSSSSFFFLTGHLFSFCACHPSPTSSYFTWCDSEVWVDVATEDTGPSLFYLRGFCCCKHIAHLLLG